MDASVDGVRVTNGFDVGQSFRDVNGDVLAGRWTVLGQGGCEPVCGFDRDVGVVLPAFEEDRRPMSEVFGVGDGVQLGVEPVTVSSGGSLVNEVAVVCVQVAHAGACPVRCRPDGGDATHAVVDPCQGERDVAAHRETAGDHTAGRHVMVGGD